VRDAFQKLPQSECKWPLLRNFAAHNSFVFLGSAKYFRLSALFS
jgi:hypothetical protein